MNLAAAPSDMAEGGNRASVYVGVFFTSAAVLLLEIALTRIFSYTIWYHFTYVTISLAMLGFGASGAVLASFERLDRLGISLARRTSLLAAASVPFMLVVVGTVPFHPFRLFKEPMQIVYMILYYLAVTSPFFFAGMTISSVFRSFSFDANRIYFFDLIGAGVGCVSIVGGIYLFGVPSVAALSASLFLFAAFMLTSRTAGARRWAIAAAAIVWIAVGISVEKLIEFKPGAEKIINAIANKKITFSRWSPIFRVDAFEILSGHKEMVRGGGVLYGIGGKDVPDDFELAFIAHDGDACAMMIRSDRELSQYGIFDLSIFKFPYLLKEKPEVLIIGPGGGVEVGVASKNEAKSVLAVELDPITVDLVANKYADFVGHIYERPEVKVVVDEGRSFLRRSEQSFDIVQMTGVDTLAALNSGAYVLAENYLYTVEAYVDFMKHLRKDGLLSVAFWDDNFRKGLPRHTGRQVSLSMEALKKMGAENVEQNIAIFYKMPYALVLTKVAPYSVSEVSTMTKFAKDHSFQIWALPGLRRNNPISTLILASQAERDEFYRSNPLDITATTDDLPFFFHYYKWSTLLKERSIDTGHSMATGQLILLLILVFSIMLSGLLIVVPLFTFRRSGLQTVRKWSYIAYFAALGLGFIFLEISYIQKFILFLGYPTYSLTVILFALLVFSGIGSYLSGRLTLRLERVIGIAVVLLALVGLGYLKVLPPVFDYFLGYSKHTRIAVSLMLLLPMGLLMGVFFPTGIRMISEDDARFVPWAWGINGCASVIGTVLSIVIAMSHGFTVVTALSVTIYIIGVSAMLLRPRADAQSA
jgi:hypothetical protein